MPNIKTSLWKNPTYLQHHFCLFYWPKQNAKWNIYKKYKNLVNCKLPNWPNRSLFRFSFTKAQRWTFRRTLCIAAPPATTQKNLAPRVSNKNDLLQLSQIYVLSPWSRSMYKVFRNYYVLSYLTQLHTTRKRKKMAETISYVYQLFRWLM